MQTIYNNISNVSITERVSEVSTLVAKIKRHNELLEMQLLEERFFDARITKQIIARFWKHHEAIQATLNEQIRTEVLGANAA